MLVLRLLVRLSHDNLSEELHELFLVLLPGFLLILGVSLWLVTSSSFLFGLLASNLSILESLFLLSFFLGLDLCLALLWLLLGILSCLRCCLVESLDSLWLLLGLDCVISRSLVCAVIILWNMSWVMSASKSVVCANLLLFVLDLLLVEVEENYLDLLLWDSLADELNGELFVRPELTG